MIHYKDLIFSIKYIIDTKDYYYQMKPEVNLNGSWKLCGYSDTECAGDKKTQKLVTECIVIINGLVIAWNSLIH